MSDLIIGNRLGMVPMSNHSAAMTGGLVQEFDHSVLPSVKPLATFILTAASMIVRHFNTVHLHFNMAAVLIPIYNYICVYISERAHLNIYDSKLHIGKTSHSLASLCLRG